MADGCELSSSALHFKNAIVVTPAQEGCAAMPTPHSSAWREFSVQRKPFRHYKKLFPRKGRALPRDCQRWHAATLAKDTGIKGAVDYILYSN